MTSNIYNSLKIKAGLDNKDFSLDDVTFFVSKKQNDSEVKYFLIVPVVINKDSTKAKDLRTNKVYTLEKSGNTYPNELNAIYKLYVDVMKDYDRNMKCTTNNSGVYSYEDVYRQFYKGNYRLNYINGVHPNYAARFFQEHRPKNEETLVAKQSEIVKFCDRLQKDQQRIVNRKIYQHERAIESTRNRDF